MASPAPRGTLFVAEKPSLGRAIAAALPGAARSHEGYIEVGGARVTWCFGHLLELASADVYDAKYKRWDLSHLPIVPEHWQLRPRSKARQQIAIIRRLAKASARLVHAGDPDREGQLLVDELIGHLRIERMPTDRLLIRDLNPAAVKRALACMRPNADFASLSESALARSRADWLYGINMSRAYTLLGQRAGYRGVLSVGRVQTPVLGLVVRRDAQIEAFVAKAYYEVQAHIPHEGKTIIAQWQPSAACAPYRDEEGRVIHRPLAENVAARIKGQAAIVKEAKHGESSQLAPLPYSLSALQIDAAKQLGMDAKAVLSTCQELYERHKLITYPRSDCRYLPEEHRAQAPSICEAIAGNASALSALARDTDSQARARAFDDSKVGAHHAIIPTPRQIGAGALPARARQIYELIARRYLMQFCPPARYREGRLVFAIGPGRFVASGKELLTPGWRALLPAPARASKSAPVYVPVLAPGTELRCEEGVILDKMTEAPKPFSDATLLQAMTGIARFVGDLGLRKILRETDGLGTEATRASIIEALFTRGFLERQNRAIRSTAVGRGLIAALPKQATEPDMTAHWERQLRDMAEARCSPEGFMTSLSGALDAMLQAPKRGEVPASLRGLEAAKSRTARPRSGGVARTRGGGRPRSKKRAPRP